MDYDLVIIGAGWAGFNAAKKAKELGLKTVIIENDQIGGTCLNRGCIPTKALLQSAKTYSVALKSKAFGIETTAPKINFTEIQARKDKIIRDLRQGMEFLLKGVDVVRGKAEITSNNTVKVNDKEISAKFILIATGSRSASLKTLSFDEVMVFTSETVLALKEIPKTLLIIGGGVIGCEFASLFSTLGSQVSIIEKLPQILPGVDRDATRKLESIYKKKGIKITTNAEASLADFKNYEVVLLSVGRVPNTEDLGLEKLWIENERGKIKVDEFLRTNVQNIYAAGDCASKIMLAHYAAYQGITAVENIAHPENPKKCDNQVIPACIFTHPQIATVGLNEEEAVKRGLEVKINKFDFLGSGMARIIDEAEGFIKIVSDAKTGVVLGSTIIGPSATELIATLGLAVSNSLNVSQIRETIFAHPTISESIHEALT